MLFGINFAVTACNIKRRTVKTKVAGTGLFGLLSGIFGIGCASVAYVVSDYWSKLTGHITSIWLAWYFYIEHINAKEINKPILCEITKT